MEQTAAPTAILKDLKRKSDDGDVGEYGEGSESTSGAGRKFASVRKIRKRIREQPEEVVSEWIEHMREELGVMKNQPWTLSDYSKLIRSDFPTNIGLRRAHFYVSEALNWAVIHNNPMTCCACLVQLLKGLHQAALNQGRWRVASLLQLAPDPLSPPEFGGLPAELAGVASYDSAINTLTNSVGSRRPPGYSPGYGPQGKGDPKGQPWKGGQGGGGKSSWKGGGRPSWGGGHW